MFCQNCGAQWPDGTRFCGQCGSSMAPAEPEYQEPVYTAPIPQENPEDATMVVNPAPYFEEQPASPYAQPPVYEQPPVYQEPVYQQPVYEQPPVYQEPVYQEPVYQQPVYQEPVYQEPVYQQPKPAKSSKGGSAMLALIAMLVSIAVIVASVFTALTTSIEKIPLVELAFDIVDDEASQELDEALEELDDSYREMKADYQMQKEYMTSEERELGEKLLELTEELTESMSLWNAFRLLDFVAGDCKDYAEEYDLDLGISEDELDEIEQIRTVALGAILAAFALPLLFALLGGLFKSKGLTVTAIVFSIMPILAFAGVIWFALSQAALITQAVACGKYRKA